MPQVTCYPVTFTFTLNTHPSRGKSGSFFFLRASLQLWILEDEQSKQKEKGIVLSTQANVD